MAQQETIKDFLVALGFKVDEKGLKTFTTTIDNATASVTKLATTITGIAVTAGIAITAFSSNLEDLYFAAQRTGNSATSLKSFEFAARNLGVSANESRAAVESLSRWLNLTPGGASWLEGLGVKTKDANGNLLETTQILQNLGAHYRNLPKWQGQQVADRLGVGYNMLLALENPQFSGDVARDKKKRGPGFDKTTADAHRYQMAIRGLGDTFEALGAKIEEALITRGGPSLKALEKWINENGDKIAGTIADWVKAIWDFGLKAAPVIGSVIEYFKKLDHDTDGLSTKILAAVVALKLLGGFGVISGILQLATAFSALAAPILAVAGALAAGGVIGTYLNGLIDKGVQSATGDKNQTLGGWLYDFAHNDTVHTPEQMVDYFKRRGYSTDQSAGLVANILAESKGDPGAVGDNGQAYGIAQWHPDRQAAFKKYTGKDIRGSTIADQLDFMQYELRFGSEQKANALLLATQNAQQAGEVVSRAYERPAASDAEAAARGRAAVQISQSTNIHVTGGGDPRATAQQVAGAQGDVNQNLVRNAQGAIR